MIDCKFYKRQWKETKLFKQCSNLYLDHLVFIIVAMNTRTSLRSTCNSWKNIWRITKGGTFTYEKEERLAIHKKISRTLRCIREISISVFVRGEDNTNADVFKAESGYLSNCTCVLFTKKWRSFYVNPSQRVLYEGIRA